MFPKYPVVITGRTCQNPRNSGHVILQVIPSEISCLRSLTLLSLAKNRLTFLPEALFDLQNLRDLDVSHNQIQGLSRSIQKLSKISFLNLENNEIRQLPQEIGRLQDLSVLKLSNNPISVLPAELASLKRMKQLTLSGCPLAPALLYSKMTPVPTLKELAARLIVRNGLLHSRLEYETNQDDETELFLSQNLRDYLDSAHECAYCQGPFFETYVMRGRMIPRGFEEPDLPIEYKLCSCHWTTEEERIRSMFIQPPITAPKPLMASSSSPLALLQNKSAIFKARPFTAKALLSLENNPRLRFTSRSPSASRLS